MSKFKPKQETFLKFRSFMSRYEKLLPESKVKADYLIEMLSRELHHELQITQEERKNVKHIKGKN